MPYLDRTGTRIYYELTGSPGSQPPLLLSHGFSASSAMWRPNVAALAADRQVITWDLRGHGRSDSPDDPGQYSHSACVADMAALLDAAGTERAVLGGLSLGGFFEFYDLFLAGYVAPGLVKAHILTTTTKGLFETGGVAAFVAFFFLGLFVGTALFGFVADRLGRRVIFMGSLLWYAAASAIMAFQHDAFGLEVWRFICGIGIGIELVTIDTYIAELAPPRARARAFAFASRSGE